MGCLSVVPGFLIQTLHCFLDSTAVLARVFESQAARARVALVALQQASAGMVVYRHHSTKHIRATGATPTYQVIKVTGGPNSLHRTQAPLKSILRKRSRPDDEHQDAPPDGLPLCWPRGDTQRRRAGLSTTAAGATRRSRSVAAPTQASTAGATRRSSSAPARSSSGYSTLLDRTRTSSVTPRSSTAGRTLATPCSSSSSTGGELATPVSYYPKRVNWFDHGMQPNPDDLRPKKYGRPHEAKLRTAPWTAWSTMVVYKDIFMKKDYPDLYTTKLGVTEAECGWCNKQADHRGRKHQQHKHLEICAGFLGRRQARASGDARGAAV